MNQHEKVDKLRSYLDRFMVRLENMDPSKASVEDIDQLLSILEKMEEDLK